MPRFKATVTFEDEFNEDSLETATAEINAEAQQIAKEFLITVREIKVEEVKN